jgi:hypothetical protein
LGVGLLIYSKWKQIVSGRWEKFGPNENNKRSAYYAGYAAIALSILVIAAFAFLD